MAFDESDGSDDDMEEVVDPSTLRPGDVVIQVAADTATAESSKVAGPRGKGAGRKLDEAEKASINAERTARLESHKLHTVTLLANASVRNKWINDPLLHARLMSLVPLNLQNNFDVITKRNQPDKAMRGRQFERALGRLTEWWHREFDIKDGKYVHIQSQTFREVQQEMQVASASPSLDLKGKSKAVDVEEDAPGEVIRSEKSLMKHALMMRGSRDTSAQLFTAVCRALSLPSRLVVSLQSVPWRSAIGNKGKPPSKPEVPGKGKEKEGPVLPDEGESDTSGSMEEVAMPSIKGDSASAFPGRGTTLNSGKAGPKTKSSKSRQKPIIRLRKMKVMGRRLGGDHQSHHNHLDPLSPGSPPVFWTEVFSRPDGMWIPVDPSRNLVHKRTAFEPPAHDRNNRMVYVVALEEDGYARDVTPRYAKEFGAKTAKIRPSSGTRGKKDWWDGIIGILARPYRLHRDDVEDAELITTQITEGMPTSVAGFKDHPLYVLQRHVLQHQAVHPLVEIGKFRGEPVYSRSNVVEVKTAENWMRVGKEIEEGEQPLKWAKTRAVTIAKKRMVEMAEMEALSKSVAGESAMEENSGVATNAGGASMQGLYAEWQTRIYEPPPVVDGKVPKNDFGNIDLYVPSMLPAGSEHLPFKGIAKVARKLGIDFAEAVIGFEFKQRRATPILDGIVVASENAEIVFQAYWETAQANEEKERQKKQDRVVKRWQKLIHGLRVRERLMKEYSVGGAASSTIATADGDGEDMDTGQAPDVTEGGGFLLDKTDVDIVQKYNLPKFQHPVVNPTTGTSASRSTAFVVDELQEDDTPPPDMIPMLRSPVDSVDEDLEEVDDVRDDMERMRMKATTPSSPSHLGVPKTMGELAEENHCSDDTSDEDEMKDVPPALPIRTTTRPLLRSVSTAKPTVTEAPLAARRASARRIVSQPASFSSPTPTASKASSSARKRQRRTRATTSSGTTAEEDSTADDSEQQESDDAKERKSKRRRGQDTTVTRSEPTPARSLRPRRGKTEAQIEEEMEMERAYRMAVAG
ncbi:hypothetical protein FRB94_001982 [Tulasnella sp. JGI-2019a]|nr:hypothetical protein FRB93_010068 [Tulasnella sp. JGI-2019a]KAG9004944.1 hypothetical protein FRB94_001982 [Tulasnella sp. JGI-2019a]KAG9030143.1 hypothetical protein FRB95_004281 [Tulasnella sp. JGI-2019a]